MNKSAVTPEGTAPAPPEAGADDNFDLVERLRKLRGQRAYEKFMALKGKIHLNIDIDELRGRNRR